MLFAVEYCNVHSYSQHTNIYVPVGKIIFDRKWIRVPVFGNSVHSFISRSVLTCMEYKQYIITNNNI
jgi:hypothetical protein